MEPKRNFRVRQFTHTLTSLIHTHPLTHYVSQGIKLKRRENRIHLATKVIFHSLSGALKAVSQGKGEMEDQRRVVHRLSTDNARLIRQVMTNFDVV